LHAVYLRVVEEGCQSGTDDRFAGNVPILFRHLAAGAISPPGGNHDYRDPARHKANSARDFGIALAHVPQLCEGALFRHAPIRCWLGRNPTG
jgi:hypothetical protein